MPRAWIADGELLDAKVMADEPQCERVRPDGYFVHLLAKPFSP